MLFLKSGGSYHKTVFDFFRVTLETTVTILVYTAFPVTPVTAVTFFEKVRAVIKKEAPVFKRSLYIITRWERKNIPEF